jgi:hypothetical protein
MSKRFLMERFLGLSQEEIKENEELWREERDQPEISTTQGQDLRSIGITPGGMESDITTGEEIAGNATSWRRRMLVGTWRTSWSWRSTHGRSSSPQHNIIHVCYNEFFTKEPEGYQDVAQDNSQPQ